MTGVEWYTVRRTSREQMHNAARLAATWGAWVTVHDHANGDPCTIACSHFPGPKDQA